MVGCLAGVGGLVGVSLSLFRAEWRRRLSTYSALSAAWYIACQSRPCRQAVMPILNSTGTGSLAVRLRCSRADRKSTRLNSSHTVISYAVFCLKKKNKQNKEKQSD